MGTGFLFFKNPVEGDDDVSLPFDGHYDAITKIADLFYAAFKISSEDLS
jgi:hypothetical protein